MRPAFREHASDEEKVTDSSSTSDKDKIKCLDGLRGIACLFVFNYHFFWPWTPHIMLGYGAIPPMAFAPYRAWTSLPIICLLHRGRAMVAIFFAISGYVICRHILRLIHEKRLEAAYQHLASAVFRRAFRLYIPPTISMFLVAVLAQMGAFRSEDDVYKGPDSVYINGTVATIEFQNNPFCPNDTVPVIGAAGMVQYMGLQSSEYLGNATDALCLNFTSRQISPVRIYLHGDEFEKQLAKVMNDTTRFRRYGNHDYISIYDGPAPLDIVNGKGPHGTYDMPLKWIQLGGTWEEHPLIHDNMTYALQNFTRVYAEWANPFRFNHYHTRYDPHTFTIPMELRGSMVIYVFLLGTAALKAKWRLTLAGLLSAYSLILGRWDVSAFLGGTLLSEVDIRLASDPSEGPSDHGPLLNPILSIVGGLRPSHYRAIRWTTMFVALYFLSYPDTAAEWTPGFIFLAYFIPRYYPPWAGWMFYQSLGAVLLLPCIVHSLVLRNFLEGRWPRYLGKISFSFYLVHGPVLHGLGFWIMPRLFERLGRTGGYLVGYFILLGVALYISDWWCKKIDKWSTTVGKRVERMLLDDPR